MWSSALIMFWPHGDRNLASLRMFFKMFFSEDDSVDALAERGCIAWRSGR